MWQLARGVADRRRLALIFILQLLWLSAVVSQSFDQVAPSIQEQISFQNKRESATYWPGVNLHLTVSAQGTNPLRYVWLLNDSIVKNSTDYSYRRDNISQSDSGVYRVIVENSFGKVRSLPFTLSIKGLDRSVPVNDTQVSVQVGGYAVLPMVDLYTYTDGVPNVEWRQNDNAISTTDLRLFKTLNSSLAVLNIPISLNQARFRFKYELSHFTLRSVEWTATYVISVSASSNQNTASVPEFVIAPRNTSAKSGQDVQLECVVNGQPLENVVISWYRVTGSGRARVDGTSGKYNVTSNNRLMTIRKVVVSDAGSYECEGSLTGVTGSVIVSRAFLTVTEPPSFVTQPQELVTADYQESVSLPCKVQGSPVPVNSWYFNGANLANSTTNGSRFEIDGNGTLSILSVDMPDSGIYQCFAYNDAGEITSYTSLLYSAEPVILEAPASVLVVAQNQTQFTCRVRGGPQPVISWAKNGINLITTDRINITQNQLSLKQAEKADSGLYSCTAVNSRGTVSANATLTVIEQTKIVRPPQNMSRILSENVVLECGVRSDPIVNVTWAWFFYRAPDFNKQNVTGGSGRYQIFLNGSLKIISVSGTDIGRYECLVSSIGGNDRAVATLNVIYPPLKPVRVQVEVYDPIPNSVLINWTITDDGNTPIIKYIVQSVRVTSATSIANNNWTTVDSNVNGSLLAPSAIIRNLLPSKFYMFRVTAVNMAGESEPSDPAPPTADKAIKIPAQPPSAAPFNVYCQPGGDKEINCSWEPPPEITWNGDLLGYTIFYKMERFIDITEKTDTTGKDARDAVITNLIPYSNYRVRIAAFNEKGPGVNSSDVLVRTRQGKPDAPPQNVSLISLSSTLIRVDWKSPPVININGAISGYDIQVSQNGSTQTVFSPFSDPEPDPNEVQTYNLSNLAKYTEYGVQVGCRTGAGLGQLSPLQTIRTLADVPGPVADMTIDQINDRSMRVNWRPPVEINGILTGYLVSAQIKNSTVGESFNRTANSTSHTFQNLVYETLYVVSVRAMTQVGLGPARTTEIVSGVPPELPGPPSSLAVTNIEAKSVLLQFVPGYDGKTTITSWLVEALTEASSSWVQVYRVSDPTAKQISVLNLHPFTRYKLRILAQNIVGVSPPSEPCTAFQTKQAAPGLPPQDVTPRVNNATSIRIRWTPIPISEWNGDFLGYKILYRRWSEDVDVNTTSQSDLNLVQEANWTRLDLGSNNTLQEYYLGRLEEWMDYQVRMLSYNAVGESESSPTLSVKTDEDVPSAYPRNVKTSPVSSTSVFVSWSPVPILQQNGKIQGYKVIYKNDKAGAELQSSWVMDAQSLNVTLTGLRKYTNYSIQLLAFTRMGDGVLSPSVTVRTASDRPGPPIIVYFPQVNETSATIMWLPPEEPNGLIQYYNVSYQLSQSPNSASRTEQDVESSVLQYTASPLQAQTYYTFYVNAKTQDGWGEAAQVDVYTIADRKRPDPPVNVRIDTSEVQARSVGVAWRPGNDNYGPVRNFSIQYRQTSESWRTVEGTIKPQLTYYVVTGLRPKTSYSFRVAAVNDVGMSDFSYETNEISTKPDKPDGAPRNVSIIAVTRTSIKVSWQPPLESTWNGQPITDFVQYREAGVDTFREEAVSFGLFTTTLQKLIIGARYEIQVVTANEVGRGPPSLLQIFLVGDVAPFEPPLDIAVSDKTSQKIVVAWKPPPDDSTNGKLINYKIYYWKSAIESCPTSDSQWLTSVVAGDKLTVTLENLLPYTLYCITVQAVNIAGEGPQSFPLPARTSEDLPGPPRNIHFGNITLRELTVYWEAPFLPNGLILNYWVNFTSVNDDKRDDSARLLPGEERQQYITDLIESQLYTFKLAAVNSKGMGETAQATVVTGPQPGSPEAPLQPLVTYRLKTLYLTWTNRGPGTAPISGYIVCYQEEGKGNQCVPVVDVDHVEPAAQISLSALKPGTGYTFVVRAINSAGVSPPSPPSELYMTPSSALRHESCPVYTQWWFLVIIALSEAIIILLIITLLCLFQKRRWKEDTEMKRSATTTTMMSATPEPEDSRFPVLELSQSSRRSHRNGPVQSSSQNTLPRSTPRPSPASIIYSEGLNLPSAGASTPAIRRPRISDETSSVLSDKPSHLGNSSDSELDQDSDDSSTNSIVKAQVPASPPPPAFSSHYRGSSSSSRPARHAPPPLRTQKPQNAYTYTDSEADSSHYAFSLNNGNIVVNNVAGARTPVSGFSSFV